MIGSKKFNSIGGLSGRPTLRLQVPTFAHNQCRYPEARGVEVAPSYGKEKTPRGVKEAA